MQARLGIAVTLVLTAALTAAWPREAAAAAAPQDRQMIQGTVVDQSGAPIAGATVALERLLVESVSNPCTVVLTVTEVAEPTLPDTR